MTDTSPPQPTKSPPKVPSESLELRARPQPITWINRRVLIGGTALLLTVIAGIVLVALRPPSFRGSGAPELYNVERKPISDGLARLPATYDGLQGQKAAGPAPTTGVPQLQPPGADPLAETARIEQSRLTRMAGQAREAPVFFRLQLKSATRDAAASGVRGEASTMPKASANAAEPSALLALRAADRSRGATGAETDVAGTDATEPTRKLGFLKSGPDKEIYNPHRLQTPASPYQLMAGTIIAASLVSGLNSDLPGFVIAQVTENVFDTVSGRHLLVPQGARLLGRYDNVVAFGQERALVIWQRLILPDGSSIVIDNLPATDTGGYAGLADAVDLHTWKLLKGVALATILGVGSSVAFGAGSGDSDIMRALRETTGQTTNRAGQRLVEKNLNVQPALTVRPGWPLRVIVHKDIVLRPYTLKSSN